MSRSSFDLKVCIQQLQSGDWKVEAWDKENKWESADKSAIQAYRNVYMRMMPTAPPEYLKKIERLATHPTLTKFCEILEKRDDKFNSP